MHGEQAALLRASPEAFYAEIRTIGLDPGFPAFFEFCWRRGAEVRLSPTAST
jgi:hypothetical protein